MPLLPYLLSLLPPIPPLILSLLVSGIPAAVRVNLARETQLRLLQKLHRLRMCVDGGCTQTPLMRLAIEWWSLSSQDLVITLLITFFVSLQFWFL